MTVQNRRLSYKAKIFSNAVDSAVNAAIAKFNLTYTQSLVLGYMRNQQGIETCQRDVERYFNIKHPTATGIISRLEQKGFVSCTHSKFDRRRKLITITDDGLSVMDVICNAVNEAEGEFFKNITKEEFNTFNEIFNKLLINIDPTGKSLFVDDANGGKK